MGDVKTLLYKWYVNIIATSVFAFNAVLMFSSTAGLELGIDARFWAIMSLVIGMTLVCAGVLSNGIIRGTGWLIRQLQKLKK